MALFLFWSAAVFIVYTYLIYPALIILFSKFRRVSALENTNTSDLPSISMIIVVYNEEEKITRKLNNCFELDYPSELLEICVLSDGSTDRTNEILRGRKDILFIEEKDQRGKPRQLNKAVSAVNGELVVFSDVRQKYSTDALRKLARNFASEDIGAVSGELHLSDTAISTGKNIGLYWEYEKMIRRAEAVIDSTLGVTGAIYAIRRDLFEPVSEDTILDDIEIPLQIFKKGYRVIFESEAVAQDISSSKMKEEWRRKVRTLAGNFQLFSRNKWLFNPFKNRIFIQTISHKFFRLLVPYAMLAVLITSAVSGGIFYSSLFIIQLIFYTSAVAACYFSALRQNRFINIIFVFTSLNWAAVVGLYKFASGRIDVRWKR
ncbi:MAG: glycosyltransferase family 2 protein [Candidatus Krumholzibacteriota bacterium]|nr:glycosyltransferase family 2 protein [Candidatus Krumholzibacteriota bacterium]